MHEERFVKLNPTGMCYINQGQHKWRKCRVYGRLPKLNNKTISVNNFTYIFFVLELLHVLFFVKNYLLHLHWPSVRGFVILNEQLRMRWDMLSRHLSSEDVVCVSFHLFKKDGVMLLICYIVFSGIQIPTYVHVSNKNLRINQKMYIIKIQIHCITCTTI